MGDILLSTLVARTIQRARPDVRIDMVIDEAYAGAVRGLPFVASEILRPRAWAGRLALAARTARRYDLAIDLHGTNAAAILARCASRGPVVGWAGKRLGGLYSHAVPDVAADRHTLEVSADLCEALGLPREIPSRIEPPCDEAATARWRARLGARSVLIHAGGRFSHKIWPAARFAVVAAHLARQGWSVHVFAGPGEAIPSDLRAYPAIEGIGAGELGSLFRAAALFVGNDSGPMHFAAGVGCRTVGIFGPSDPCRWRPWSPLAGFVSAPCSCGSGSTRPCRTPDRWCLASIHSDQVLAAIDRVLALPDESACHRVSEESDFPGDELAVP